jgi:hypothetical protein
MKNLFHLTAAFILFNAGLQAQTLQVESRPMKNEESRDADAWIAHLDQPVSYCMGTYSDFMKKTFSAKIDKRAKNVLSVNKTMFPEVSNLRIDQRAVFAQESSGTAVAFMFSPGYDIHFGKELYNAEFVKGETFVKNYIRYHYKTFYDETIKDIQGKIKSKQKSINSNQSKIEKNLKSMKENDEDIAVGSVDSEKLKGKNVRLEKENADMNAEIEKLNTEISGLNAEIAKANESLQLVEGYR